MAIVFHRGLAIPLWAAASCAVALSTLPRVTPSLIALLAISAIALMPAFVRWLRLARPLVHVLPAFDQDAAPTGIILTAGTRTRMLDEAMDAPALANDAADLGRMDDDGGLQSQGRSPALTEGLHSQNRAQVGTLILSV